MTQRSREKTKAFTSFSVRFTLACALLLSCALPAHAAKQKKPYRFVTYIDSASGVGAGQGLDIFNQIIKEVKKNTGIEVEFILRKKIENSYDTTAGNQSDFCDFSTADFLRSSRKQESGILPIASYSIRNEPKDAFCLWIRSDTQKTTIQDMAGSNYIASYFDSRLVALRKYLLENNIDKPLWEFFSTFTKAPNGNSVFYALGLRKADATWTQYDYDFALKLLDPAILKKARRAFCTAPIYDRTTLIANASTVSRDDYKKLIAFFKNAGEHPEKYEVLKPYLSMVKTFKVKLVIAPEIDMAFYRKLDTLAEKNGWYHEIRYIAAYMKNTPPGQTVHIPPPAKPIPECVKLCRKNKNLDPCVDKCMAGSK